MDARGNLGVTLYFKGDYAQAAPHLRAAVKLRPNLWKIQALPGMSERRSGQIAAAQAGLEKCFSRLQDDKLRIQDGLELIERAIQTAPLRIIGKRNRSPPADRLRHQAGQVCRRRPAREG